MSQLGIVHIIALVGWLILAISAFASYGLSWKASLRQTLIWAVIFTGLALLITIIR
tara:strand:- start:435 stop:602 length:168 start_codon:yes stop_codon:yes gene_type:complete